MIETPHPSPGVPPALLSAEGPVPSRRSTERIDPLQTRAERCSLFAMSKGPPSPPKSPQDKKALSYANDTRHEFDGSNKAARRAVPARKAGENRKSRRKAAQVIKNVVSTDDVLAETAESSLRHDVERVGGWTKSPDIRLRDFINRRSREED